MPQIKIHPEIKEIDDKLIEIADAMGELYYILDNPKIIKGLDLNKMRKTLERLHIPESEYSFFLDKERNSLIKQIDAVTAIRTPEFTKRGIDYFENLTPSRISEYLKDAETVLIPPRKEAPSKRLEENILSIPETISGIEKALETRGVRDSAVVYFDPDYKGTIAIRNYLTKPSEIIVGPTTKKTQTKLRKTIVHEIEGHNYRLLNGKLQPIKSSFALGTSSARVSTEEGYTKEVERRSGFEVDLRTSAANLIAVDAMLKGATFNDIKKQLSKYDLKESTIERIATKVKRGVDPNKEGGFVRQAAYFLGDKEVRKFLYEENGSWDTLSIGKISIGDVPKVEELLEQGKLVPAKYKVPARYKPT